MGLVATIARRSLLQRLPRTLFSILGIAVGIATVVAIFALDHNTVVGRSLAADPSWQAEIEVSPSAEVQDPHADLARVPGVTAVTAAFQNEIVLTTSDGGAQDRVHLVALEPEHASDLGAYLVQAGRGLQIQSERREMLIGEQLSTRFHVGPGDTVMLGRPRREPGKECVDGEWRPIGPPGRVPPPPKPEAFEVVGILAREGVGRMARGEVVVIDLRFGKTLFEGAHVDTRYWLKHDPSVNLERIQSSLGRAWSYDLKKSVIIGQAADERAFRNGVRFAGLFALVLGLYVIFHTLSMSLVERVRQIGVLHALGATRAQIARIFFAEALVIAGLAGAFGLAGGLLLARVLLRRGITTVGAGEYISFFEVPWHTVGPIVAAGVGMALLGSVYPLARVRGTSAVAALRGEDAAKAQGMGRGFRAFAALLLAVVLPALYFQLVPVIGEAQAELIGVLMIGLGILALFISLPLLLPSVLSWVCVRLARPFERRWPLAGLLAARSMQKTPVRVAGATAGLALVTAAFVGLQGMTRSLEDEIRIWGSEAFLQKVYVRNFPRTLFQSFASHLSRYPGVLGVEPNEARTYVPFLMMGLREEQLIGWGPCKKDPSLVQRMRDENGVILSKRLARHRGYSLGDAVHVSTPRGAVLSLPVIAISDAYGYFPHPDERLYGVVSDRFMHKVFCLDTEFITSASVRLAPGSDATVVKTAVHELFPDTSGISVEDGPRLYAWYTSDIARDFILFDIILSLTVLLAGLGVLNGQLLSALERAKELGILRALGVTRRQVTGMVQLEALVVGVIGGGLGLALGLALAPVIVSVLRVISGLPLPVPGLHAYHLFAWLGAILVSVLAGVYPIWWMNRMNAVAAVRSA
jgi:putative ABC transport system permease protein